MREKNSNPARTADMIKIAVMAILILAAAFLVLFVNVPAISVIHAAEAKNGKFALSDVMNANFNEDMFRLEGEWEFYPNQLLSPSDFTRSTPRDMKYVTVPHRWNDERIGNPLNTAGYATYRLTLEAPPEIHGIGLHTMYQFGAYRIYLGGALVAETGKVSENRGSFYFANQGSAGYASFGENGSIEIIIQMQCYDHVDAGLRAPQIGSVSAVESFREFIKLLTGGMVGAIMILTLYFILIFFRNKDKKEYLNFAVVSFCCLYLTLITCGELIVFHLTPEVSGHVIYKLEFIAYAISAFFVSVHVIEKYTKSRIFRKIGIAYTGALCILAAVISTYNLSAIRMVFRISSGLLVLVALAVCFNAAFLKAKAKKKQGALIEFISLFLLYAGITASTMGVLAWNGFIMYPVVIISYCFLQIFLLAGYYKTVEMDLAKLARNLENRVTERTAALVEMNKKVQSANNIKSEFLTRMSREISAPMKAIVGMSDLFDKSTLSDIQKAYFNNINETSHALLNLIGDVMDFSKIESGKLELLPTHFRLHDFVNNIISAGKLSAGVKGLDFTGSIDENLPAVIQADENRIKQIIMNIINNAVKYTHEGSVSMNVTMRGTPGNPGTTLIFSVKDTGIGIAAEDIPHLFQAFIDSDSPRHKGIVGMGLRLAICKKLMDMMQGQIEVISKLGKGSEFKLYFPLTPGDEKLVAKSMAGEKIYAKDAKILLVEDNKINITVALGILATHDITPDIARNGNEALAKLRDFKNDYDLIFMDQFLPGMDGTEVTQQIRKLGGKYTSIPIIALTANAAPGAKEMLLFNGMSDYIPKPINRGTLNNVLIRWLPHDKISSALGDIKNEGSGSMLAKLPKELIEITEINCASALRDMDGNAEIYMKLLRQFAEETEEYVKNLENYLEEGDFINYVIVIHGVKSLLYNIGAKISGDMASRLEKTAGGKNKDECREKNEALCENIRWLSQRIRFVLSMSD